MATVSTMSDSSWRHRRKMSRSRSDQTYAGRLPISPPTGGATPPSPGNPPIALPPDGAPVTPPKKKWELQYKKHLTRRLLGSPRSLSSGETTRTTNSGGNGGNGEDDGSGRSGIFPGSLRIAHRKKSDLLPPLASMPDLALPAMPDLAPSKSNDDAAVRGGNFFQTVFSRERSISTDSNSHYSSSSSRRIKSTDSLDATLRCGQDKTISPKNPRFVTTQLDEPPVAARGTVAAPSPPPPPKLDDRPVHGGVAAAPPSPEPQRVPSALASALLSASAHKGSSREMKKAFTEFHNSAQFSLDASSPYLGDDPSTRRNTRNDYLAMPKQHQSSNSGLAMAMSERNLSALLPPKRMSASSLPVVNEDAVVVNRSVRMLKPVQGPESWEAGCRYLIAPAALSMCPLFVASLLDRQERVNNSESVFCPIELGTATVKYVGSHHQEWTACRFLLRQNYLMEYPEETKGTTTTTPRGFAHLQYAKAYPHDDFSNALELEFYASPCSRSDKRVLFMRVATRKERDRWVTCLNDAAQLRIEDLYDYNEGCVVGQGRYASVYPARRRQTEDEYGDGDDSGTACALKIIDKNEFWRRVVDGVERADTIVRETSVQATLTAKCAGGVGARSSTTAFTQIRGIFETSNHFVLELELLEGVDLFRHVSSKSGVMEEDEAARIMRDIFTSLDLMARNGIAHRDIKPANILMCHRGRTTNGGGGGEVSVKVADFGMAGFTGVDGHLRGRCGTPGYVAPEMWTTSVHGGYGNKVDVYSAGVTLYLLLCGYEPFYGESDAELIAANKAAIIDYPEEDWSRISLEARDLVERTLERDPMKRISAKEALEHPWIVTRAPPTVVADSSKSLTEEGPTCTVS